MSDEVARYISGITHLMNFVETSLRERQAGMEGLEARAKAATTEAEAKEILIEGAQMVGFAQCCAAFSTEINRVFSQAARDIAGESVN